MKLENYNPTFRNVLLQEIEVTQTKGGVILPTVYLEDKEYKVVKTGKDCTETQKDDTVKLLVGIRPQDIKLDSTLYVQVPEQQIVGYERE